MLTINVSCVFTIEIMNDSTAICLQTFSIKKVNKYIIFDNLKCKQIAAVHYYKCKQTPCVHNLSQKQTAFCDKEANKRLSFIF